jgi:rRNA-processing protein Efg1
MQQEGLGADVRIEAERKLKALEADLVVAERANKERVLATRYHKVKFFGAYCTSYLLGAFSNEDQIVRNSCVRSGRQKGNSRTKRYHLKFGKLSRQNCLI